MLRLCTALCWELSVNLREGLNVIWGEDLERVLKAVLSLSSCLWVLMSLVLLRQSITSFIC